MAKKHSGGRRAGKKEIKGGGGTGGAEGKSTGGGGGNNAPLTDDQMRVVDSYVSYDFGGNGYLRGLVENERGEFEKKTPQDWEKKYGKLSEQDKKDIKTMSDATNKKIPEGKTLYRSASAEEILGKISNSDMEMLNFEATAGTAGRKGSFSERFNNRFKGKRGKDDGFVSTSSDKEFVESWGSAFDRHPAIVTMTTGPKTRGLNLKKHAPHLEKILNQHETILHNGSSYTVNSVKVDDWGTFRINITLD